MTSSAVEMFLFTVQFKYEIITKTRTRNFQGTACDAWVRGTTCFGYVWTAMQESANRSEFFVCN